MTDIPTNLKYTKNHEWILVTGNTARVGITDFAQTQLGDVVFVDIPTVGKKLRAEDVFGTVEAVKTVSDLFLPVSGTITKANPELDDEPELINHEPYGDGWMIEITLSNTDELNDLLTAAQYKPLTTTME
ncbi:glycine cleavage system protein GcvH [Streptomyces sp. 1331.2]|uniref:glycine cleavage system protein GcvH n=1 Tax=Streptomyces sp. 1331.2 TaxID=1938835 RepID=UPI000BDDAA43|nr:glycine cleavage system protein GcvH [Streptomyces sp. 1331.2]SOB88820.1 glycine cleavage system H protein [Streptomyces sp. 1331.2]